MWLRTAKSRAWMRECHRFDSKLDTSDAVGRLYIGGKHLAVSGQMMLVLKTNKDPCH